MSSPVKQKLLGKINWAEWSYEFERVAGKNNVLDIFTGETKMKQSNHSLGQGAKITTGTVKAGSDIQGEFNVDDQIPAAGHNTVDTSSRNLNSVRTKATLASVRVTPSEGPTKQIHRWRSRLPQDTYITDLGVVLIFAERSTAIYLLGGTQPKTLRHRSSLNTASATTSSMRSLHALMVTQRRRIDMFTTSTALTSIRSQQSTGTLSFQNVPLWVITSTSTVFTSTPWQRLVSRYVHRSSHGQNHLG